ncbi:hypothetical protein LCGC14_0267280 [marine sediment metagenome]|uniref:Uncharacterized protein n=1 Tax=marine sediment metagenome TaxID=412755 RepID=A0A0F9UGQ5_9ZZZZ
MIKNSNNEVDIKTLEEILGQLQEMTLLRSLNDQQYSPALVTIIKTRYDQNVVIEEELRKWAAMSPKERYPYPDRYDSSNPIDEEDEE